MNFKARAYRPRHKAGEMNGTELKYCYYLDMLKKAGEILDYSFECTKLKIGNDCWYTPDFRVIKDEGLNSGWVYNVPGEETPRFVNIEFHEVKGTVRKKSTVVRNNRTPENGDILSINQLNMHNTLKTKPFIEDDALVKIKAVAELHPYKFIIVWEGLNGQWEKREIN